MTYSDTLAAASPSTPGGGEEPAALELRPQPGGDPRARGRLDVGTKVVQKVAEAAARRVRGVQLVQPSGMSRLGGGGSAGLPTSARVLGQTASVSMQIAVGYPGPVREICRQVRKAIHDDVRQYAGVEVSRLDLEVVALSNRRSRDAMIRRRTS